MTTTTVTPQDLPKYGGGLTEDDVAIILTALYFVNARCAATPPRERDA